MNEDDTRSSLLLSSGTVVGQYRISDRIGAGGMGEVYLAADTSLDRQVALKFLPSHLVSSDELTSRFVREAKAAARLSHPNIVTIYEVGTHLGRPFFAMEYVQGRTLGEVAHGERPAIPPIIEIALQICQGLGEAHRAGIVHRDIKSSNIILDSSERVRILDFGLAAVAGSEEITKTGSTLGTVSYMSPEQVSGRTVDRRSDLFSLGIVLYELLTGRTPFRRQSEGATLNAIMQDQPEPIRKDRPDTPEALERIVEKLLEKDIELRYQSAEGVLADLKKLLYDSQQSGISRERTTVDDRSIAVIPFVNIGADPENEYFSDGLTEELITDLSGLSELRVISRSSSHRLKGTDKDVRTIGLELNVRYILSGSVRKAGNNVRITTQLVDATTDRQVWADKYKGTLEDIFEIQEEVSSAIVSTLKLALTKSEKEQLGARPIKDVRAYECYLRARQELNRWDATALDTAEKHIRNGLRLAGDNALLYAGLAYVYFQRINTGGRLEDNIARVSENIEKALAIDPKQPQVHLVQGLVAQAFEGDPQQAIDSFKRVLEVDPNNPDALIWLGIQYTVTGHMDLARELSEALSLVDPLSASSASLMLWVRLMTGDLDGYVETARTLYEANPDSGFHRRRYAVALAIVGKPVEGLITRDDEQMDSFYTRLGLMIIYGMAGQKEKALACVNDEFISSARRDPQFSWFVATGYAACEMYDESLDWLENAFNRGFANYKFVGEYDPVLIRMRGMDRFESIVSRMKQAHDALKV